MKLRLSRFSEMMRFTSISSARGESCDLAEREHQPFQFRHVQRRRRSLPGDVRDQHPEALAGEVKEIVVVPADLTGGTQSAVTAKPGRLERPAREQRHLDLPCDPELLFHPLLFRRRQQQPLDAAGHLVERPGELAELVVRVTLMRCVKSPCRTRSVPMKSSWIELVIDLASASPIRSATPWMMRNKIGDDCQHNQEQLTEVGAGERDAL